VITLPVANKLDTTDPPILLAILMAARRVGNRLLESVARRELEERYGIRVAHGPKSVLSGCRRGGGG
jgi:hypothetical protein